MFVMTWTNAIAAFLLTCGAAVAGPTYEPQTVPNHAYTGGWEHYVGGGLAVFDCDDDGRLDLMAAGGTSPPTLWRNISEDQGKIRFEVMPMPELTATTGAYPIDIDNDSVLDLVLMRVGPDMILRGLGSCEFTPTSLPDITFTNKWTTAFSATWEAGNTRPTLAFGHYVDRTNADGPFEACDKNLLLRPDGDFYKSTPLTPGFCPLSMLFSDWDRDGTSDLRVSNDRHYYVRGGAEQLWDITNTPRLYGETDGWVNHEIWGMGIASRDIDRNGLADVFLSSMGDQRLQEWTGKGAEFKDVPFDRGAAAHKPYTGGDGRPSTGWHISIGDVQNDGLDDVFIAKGNVQQMPGMAMDDPNNLLIQTSDATFVETGFEAGIASLHRARGAALADFNADGLLDLAVVNRVAPLEVYRNTTADTGNWLSIEPRQQGINTRAIGGWIELMDDYGLQLRELTIGGGHAGGILGPQHFGLDQAETVSFRIIWPDGTHSEWAKAKQNQRLQVIRSGTTLDIFPY
jgi:hypothetical protein